MQRNSDNYTFFPMNINGSLRYIPTLSSPTLCLQGTSATNPISLGVDISPSLPLTSGIYIGPGIYQNVTSGSNPNPSIHIGRNHFQNKLVLQQDNGIHIGTGIATNGNINFGGAVAGVHIGNNQFNNCPNTFTLGQDNVCLGRSICSNSTTGQIIQNIKIGSNICENTTTFETPSTSNIFIGYGVCRNNPSMRSANVLIGTSSFDDNNFTALAAGNSYITAVGALCGKVSGGSPAPARYETLLGALTLASGVEGRFSFGGSVAEAVATTATAGAQTLPAQPAGFWPIQYRGTNYKIPLYNP